MREQTVAAALEAEHHEIDRGLSAFDQHLASGSWNAEPLHRAADALRRHIYLEEEFLFPALRELGLIAPVAVMLREHGEIWLALDAVERAAAEETDAASAQHLYTQLSNLLTAHNDKEEVILYPAADNVLDAAELARLKDLITSGTLPPGWVCEHARGDSVGTRSRHEAQGEAAPSRSRSSQGEHGHGA